MVDSFRMWIKRSSCLPSSDEVFSLGQLNHSHTAMVTRLPETQWRVEGVNRVAFSSKRRGKRNRDGISGMGRSEDALNTRQLAGKSKFFSSRAVLTRSL